MRERGWIRDGIITPSARDRETNIVWHWASFIGLKGSNSMLSLKLWNLLIYLTEGVGTFGVVAYAAAFENKTRPNAAPILRAPSEVQVCFIY